MYDGAKAGQRGPAAGGYGSSAAAVGFRRSGWERPSLPSRCVATSPRACASYSSASLRFAPASISRASAWARCAAEKS